MNGVIALILLYFTEWLKINLYCLQNIVFHFWPKLTHHAERSLIMWLPTYHSFHFKQTGMEYHIRITKSGILRQRDNRVRTVRWYAVLLKRGFLSK